MVRIDGLSKAAVLAVLYNHAKPQGLGLLHYEPWDMTEDEAAEILRTGRQHFDYVKGRVMKVSLDNDHSFEERLYDRDNGPGAAQAAIDSIRG